MNVFSLLSARLICSILLVLLPATLQAQNPAATPSQAPGPRPAPSGPGARYTEQQMQDIITKLQDRVEKAADSVIGRIQKEETAIRLKFNYLRKPERLDPNTFASKSEISLWRDSLQQLKEKENGLDKLYADAEQDLGNALVQQRINQGVADQIKNELLKSFPWAVIKKKSALMQDFLAAHGALLDFYDKNWGSWQADSGSPKFDNPKLAATYQDLKVKINTTGEQIDDQYKIMVQ
jgi:hypothetical protein